MSIPVRELCISSGKYLLNENWRVTPSGNVDASINKAECVVSTAKCSVGRWYKTDIPSTLMAILVKNGVYKNPYHGENMKLIPEKIFKSAWWFRNEFRLPTDCDGKTIWLYFDGIVYKADIWLNGHLIADNTLVEGSFRRFAFDVSRYIVAGKPNYLAVKLYPQKPGDLSIGFADWNPVPPDKNTGIWQNVYIRATGPVSIEHPYVRTDLCDLDLANITVTADLTNAHHTQTVHGLLEGRIEGIRFAQEVTIPPNEKITVKFSPKMFPQLKIKNPRVWWPYQMGSQEFYELEMQFKIDKKISDERKLRFGIRSVSTYLNKEGNRGIEINGKKILIRGGGWTDDLMLNHSIEDSKTKIQYVKSMNLNTVRVESIWGTDDLYDLCDENGIIVIAGWSCHWEWEYYLHAPVDDKYGGVITNEKIEMATKYMKDQTLRLRVHPSVCWWIFASDRLPHPDLEKNFIDLFKTLEVQTPYIAAAAGLSSEITGATGVKMLGPYDYVPPFYYYMNRDKGGAFGFATEEGPGSVIPRDVSMKRMLPKDKWWPINKAWKYHDTLRKGRDLKTNTLALNAQYGKAKGIDDYCKKSQLMNYDAARALFESWGRNKYSSTGIIAWMLNSAWPSIGWQLFDAYLLPGGAFYGSRKACEQLHVQYSYDDNSIWVVNNYYKKFKNLTVMAEIYSFEMSNVFSKSLKVDIREDSSKKAFDIKIPKDITPVFFLKIVLTDETGVSVSENFYCLSSKAVPGLVDSRQLDALANDEDYNAFKGNMSYLVKTPADFGMLNNLPSVTLDKKCIFRKKGKNTEVIVSLKNQSDSLAFFVHLDITKGSNGDIVIPVFWESNYISLLPKEKKVVKAVFPSDALNGVKPHLKVSGWNIIETS